MIHIYIYIYDVKKKFMCEIYIVLITWIYKITYLRYIKIELTISRFLFNRLKKRNLIKYQSLERKYREE